MPAIAIQPEMRQGEAPRFRAIAGNRHAVGRTMGEALDAFTAQWGESLQETAVLIQRFQPDAHFSAAQYDRMQALLARRATLTRDERTELEALIDAELEATVARTDALMPPHQP